MAQIGEPGRHDEQAVALLEETEADAVVVIVFNGNQGHGFSLSANSDVGPALVKSGALSAMLHRIADDLTTAEPTGVRVDMMPRRSKG